MPKSSAPGQLISVDAIHGQDLIPTARRLLNGNIKRSGGFSPWDASSIFFELHGVQSEVEQRPSPQTLVLLYAADLRFRVRWNIQPALEIGQTVVAAPYTETGIAFGLALGLPRRWVTEVFRFAPKPSASFWVSGTRPAKPSPMAGFLEFCGDALPKDFFVKFAAHFDALERRGKCRPM